MAVKGGVMEFAISFRLWGSLFFITFHAFTVTNSDGVCDGVSF